MRTTTRALAELINQKRSGKTIAAKPRPKGDNVVDLMEALKKSISNERAAPTGAKGKRPSKAAAGQREMLLPISGKASGEGRSQEGEQASHRKGAPACVNDR